MQEVVLSFKYKCNHMIDLGNLEQYPVPMVFKTEVNALGHVVPQQIYDMEKIHYVRLGDETPRLPVREDGMSQKYYEELCDDEFRRSREERNKNSSVVTRIKHYAQTGVIEVIDNPFERETESDSVIAAREKKSEPAKVKPR